MNIIILAAGIGKRLLPETENVPKGMVKLFDKSLIEMQLDIFKKCGIDDISIVTGYLAEIINFPSINYFKNENFSTTHQNESIYCARQKLNDTIICYADLIFDISIIKKMINFKGDIGIAVRSDWKSHYKGRILHPLSEADNVLIDESGKIIEIRKNIQKPNSNIGEFLGIVRLSSKGSSLFLKRFSEYHIGTFHSSPSIKQSILPDMLQELIDLGINVEPVMISEKWSEVDTPQDLDFARKNFKHLNNST
jgi:phosphoenolpyruvate phosphomutase